MYVLWWDLCCFNPDFMFVKLRHSNLAARPPMAVSRDSGSPHTPLPGCVCAVLPVNTPPRLRVRVLCARSALI